jgi:hypothetical protein
MACMEDIPALLFTRLMPHATCTTVITPSTAASSTSSMSRDVITHSRDVTLDLRVLERCQDFVRRCDNTVRFARVPSEKPIHDTTPVIICI